MAESLSPMTVVCGQQVVLYVDQANPLIPKVVIPARDFKIGETIKVWFGDILVGTHRYREGDFFPIHIALDKEALAMVTGTSEARYEIEHLDEPTSTSSSFRAKVELFNSQSSLSHANEIEA